jgi:thioredoxin-like negative regulator of GroEL
MRQISLGNIRQKIFLIFMVLGFINIMSAQAIQPMLNLLNQSHSAQEQSDPSSDQDFLAQQEAGYRSVLEREPENRTALEGLVEVRMLRNNASGALEILDQLIALEPDNQTYKTQRVAIENHIAQSQPGQAAASQP